MTDSGKLSYIGCSQAVLWTDVFQSFLMFGAVIAVAAKGVVLVGGLDEVYQRALDGDRLHLWK